jgi:diguanylate cyclase (GGDEF)-like protein
MSPRFASLARRAKSLDSAMLITAAAAAALTALAVVAGSRLGPAALALVAPAALLAVTLRRRTDARHAGLMHLANLDPLTGLGNPRLLRQRMTYELARHRRFRRRLTVLVLDLDGFKQLNDRFGHVAGDEMLREVARQLERAVREQDTVVRQGGDEFCILAPETGFREAERLAERLALAIGRAVGGLEGMSASIGFAVFPDEGATPEMLIASADNAAMDAKRRARQANARPQLRAA